MAEVLVVGAGPVGLTVAAELVRHGVRCRIIDRLPEPSPYCRAIGVTPRTLEVWDDMGIAREMIDAGLWLRGLRSKIHGHPPNDSHPDFGDLPYAPLGVPQYATERVLTVHLARLGITVERGVELLGFEQDADGVNARLRFADGGEEALRLRYLVGCDGAHSPVRRGLGIAFPGDAFPWPFMLGDVHIDWDLPRGTALRALRLVENAPPDMFIAVPLPEPGRYRVSMMAPAHLERQGGTDHGIQSETPGPTLDDLQAVADALLPDRPRLADLRWSSVYRISMRLAERYRVGRCFIAGDAAHIHPPTGGQGMNTGIQDAYNLAWKLALVVRGDAPEALLDSYEAERLPVGADVVARTRAASEGYGREKGGKPDRLADTQIRISYKDAGWVREDAADLDPAIPAAGDRALDAIGLRRNGVGFPLRLFDVLRGTDFVLLAHLHGPGSHDLDELSALSSKLAQGPTRSIRVVAVTRSDDGPERHGLALYHDAEGSFAAAYGAPGRCFLVRPDGHIGWRGPDWRAPGLALYLERIFAPPR